MYVFVQWFWLRYCLWRSAMLKWINKFATDICVLNWFSEHKWDIYGLIYSLPPAHEGGIRNHKQIIINSRLSFVDAVNIGCVFMLIILQFDTCYCVTTYNAQALQKDIPRSDVWSNNCFNKHARHCPGDRRYNCGGFDAVTMFAGKPRKTMTTGLKCSPLCTEQNQMAKPLPPTPILTPLPTSPATNPIVFSRTVLRKFFFVCMLAHVPSNRRAGNDQKEP